MQVQHWETLALCGVASQPCCQWSFERLHGRVWGSLWKGQRIHLGSWLCCSERPRGRSLCCPGLWIGLGMSWVAWSHHGGAQQGLGAQCRARCFSKVLFGANLFGAQHGMYPRGRMVHALQGKKIRVPANEEWATPCCNMKGCAQFSPILVYLRTHLRWVRHTQTREQLMAEVLPRMLLKPYATPSI